MPTFSHVPLPPPAADYFPTIPRCDGVRADRRFEPSSRARHAAPAVTLHRSAATRTRARVYHYNIMYYYIYATSSVTTRHVFVPVRIACRPDVCRTSDLYTARVITRHGRRITITLRGRRSPEPKAEKKTFRFYGSCKVS